MIKAFIPVMFTVLLFLCTVSFIVTGGGEVLRVAKYTHKNNLKLSISMMVRYGLKDIALAIISFYGILEVNSACNLGVNMPIWSLINKIPLIPNYMVAGFLVGTLTGMAFNKVQLYIELLNRDSKGGKHVKPS